MKLTPTPEQIAQGEVELRKMKSYRPYAKWYAIFTPDGWQCCNTRKQINFNIREHGLTEATILQAK